MVTSDLTTINSYILQVTTNLNIARLKKFLSMRPLKQNHPR